MNTKDYRPLPGTGLSVSPICLGTMNFGASERGTSKEEAHNIINHFLEMGGNFIDTADVYNGGASETIVGSWIESNPERRQEIVLASKVFFQGGRPNPNDAGLSRNHITNTITKQLERLKTDYLDILQIHNWDSRTNVNVWIQTFADLISQGKIRHYGVCNVTGWQLQKIISTADNLKLPRPVVCQMQYNLLSREVEWEVLHCCAANNVAFLPWSPLKGGWLTGKYERNKTPNASTRVGAVEKGEQKALQSHPSYSEFATEKTWALLDKMKEIAGEQQNCTVAQVAIGWLLKRPMVSSVIIGPRTLEQMVDCVGSSTNVSLSDNHMMSLNERSSTTPMPYPYEMVWRCSRPLYGQLDGKMWPLQNSSM
jgi:aryl-alcohol dehydrogenase-like predicted oxidoreductase